MPYNLRKKSPILEYQNYISCGNYNCKDSCLPSNSLTCKVCSTWFHYKCVGMSKKAYIKIMNCKSAYICSNKCYNVLLPFYELDHIDLLTSMWDSIQNCHKCKKGCLKNKCLMDSIPCDFCPRRHHFQCTNLSYDQFKRIVNNGLEYPCSDKCEMMLFPFSHLDNLALTSLNLCYPCKVCKQECVSDCIQCDLCDWWLHAECIEPEFSLNDYTNNDKPFMCDDKRCQVRQLPFHSSEIIISSSYLNSSKKTAQYDHIISSHISDEKRTNQTFELLTLQSR